MTTQKIAAPEQELAESAQDRPAWWIYRGDGVPRSDWKLPPPPPWRKPRGKAPENPRAIPPAEPLSGFQVGREEIELVNAALHLRRPLLVTGAPGTGKSTLARAVAYELQLGRLLRWPINSRSTLHEGLYRYEAVGRLQDASLPQGQGQKAPPVGDYLHLGPLGTALLPGALPRALLIDEFDKSDIDLPSDLLDVIEEGCFEIPELTRAAKSDSALSARPADGDAAIVLQDGWVRCAEFPLVIITSNGERDFPPAFLRRCLRLDIQPPDRTKLEAIVRAQLSATWQDWEAHVEPLIAEFLARREKAQLATDQLLNAIYLCEGAGARSDRATLVEALMRRLSAPGS